MKIESSIARDYIHALIIMAGGALFGAGIGYLILWAAHG